MNELFLAVCAVLVVVPLVFVANDVYEEGVFGRIGLLGVAFAAATFLIEWAVSDDWPESPYEVLPQTLMLVSCFAIFLCWHLFRFHSRVLSKKKAGVVD